MPPKWLAESGQSVQFATTWEARCEETQCRWAVLLREGQQLLPPGSAGRARLDEQASFIDFVNKEIPAVIARWEEYRAGSG